MKNKIIILLLFLVFISGYSQNSRDKYSGRLMHCVKKEKLNEAKFIGEIMPGFYRYFVSLYNEHAPLDQQLSLMDYPTGFYPQENYIHPRENYIKIIDYVFVEISTTSNGKALTSQNTNDLLTIEQKNILNAADLGSDISIKIKFKFKKPSDCKSNIDGKIIEGKYLVTVVPETEAEYPGGFKQLTEYFKKNVTNKISEKNRQAIVKFVVNEEGQIVAAKISGTSADPKIDKLFLDAINKMPKWKPAKNLKGIKVKQEFSISLESSSGC